MIPSLPFASDADAQDVHLRLLATTDLHMHVHAYDYYRDQPQDDIGLARLSRLIADMRSASPNLLLLDNGDYLQGNPMGDFMAMSAEWSGGAAHPIISAMNQLGYDAGTLGNHEFNYGVDYMDRVNAGADYPLVCANFATRLAENPLDDVLHLPPYALLKRKMNSADGNSVEIKVGVIGFLPPQVTQWDRWHLGGQYFTRDILDAARFWLPEMRRQGADIIVALCHSGISDLPEKRDMEHAALHLAAIDGIDALVLGHQHRIFPDKGFIGEGIDPNGFLHGKPATMPGFHGSHLGLIDLLLEPNATGWRVKRSQSAIEAVAQYDTSRSDGSAYVLPSALDAHQATLDYIRRPVGFSEVPLHSYFSLIAPDPTLELIADAQLWVAAEMRHQVPDLPVLSAAAPFKAGGPARPDNYVDIPAGPIAIRNIADIYHFPNTIQLIEVTGADIRAWLERSACIFRKLTPGDTDQHLIRSDFPAHNFDVIYGLTYEIDLSADPLFQLCGDVNAEATGRIRNLMWQGQSVTEDMRFLVVTNNYRGDGGGNFPVKSLGGFRFNTRMQTQDALIRYVTEMQTVAPRGAPVWRFAALPGTRALYTTGAGARAFKAPPHAIEIAECPDRSAVYSLIL